jgi:hypothetical protein
MVQADQTSITSVTQPSALWLDLRHARDVTFYFESVSHLNESFLVYETAPTRDANQFRAMAEVSTDITTVPLVTKIQLYDNPSVPLARWVRWRLRLQGGTGLWNATFRIIVRAQEG